jgi:hypothetical protein
MGPALSGQLPVLNLAAWRRPFPGSGAHNTVLEAQTKVALARNIAVILHRMWVDNTTYRWTDAQLTVAQGMTRRNTRSE